MAYSQLSRLRFRLSRSSILPLPEPLALGGSQTDIANLEADHIDWKNRVIGYARKKTGSLAFIHFGPEIESVLRRRPDTGFLFPYLQGVRAGDRATEFKQPCGGLSIQGVTLHSTAMRGYPERFAQEALGHNSKAVHRAYAKRAQVTLPSLEQYERLSHGHVLPMNPWVLFNPRNTGAMWNYDHQPHPELWLP